MPNVVFTVDAEVAKAVQGVLKVVEAQGKAKDGFKGVGAEAKTAGASIEKIGVTFNRFSGAQNVAEVRKVITELEAEKRAIEAVNRGQSEYNPRRIQRESRDALAGARGSAGADAVAAEVRQRAKDRAAALAEGQAQIELNNFDLKVRKQRASSAESIKGSQAADAVAAQVREEKKLREAEAATNAEIQRQIELNNFDLRIRKDKARLAQSVAGSSGADAVAATVREEAAARKQRIADGQTEIDLNNFGNRQDKRRQYAGRLAPTQFAQDHPEAFDRLALVGTAGGIAIGGMLALGSVLGNVQQTFEAVNKAGTSFEDEIRGLLSLGNNLDFAPRVRERVMDASVGLGVSTGDASTAMFDLQSRAVNRSAEEQKQIFNAAAGLHGVTGGNLGEEIKGLIGLLDTYGQELGTADVAASKLLATQERSGITVQELAELMPTIAPAAKLLGHSYDEVSAAVETTTHVLGNNEKVIAGLREVFVKLAEAQQEGLVHAGSLTEQFKELSRLDPNQFEKLFGARAAGVAAAMAQHTGEIAENLRQMQAVSAGKVTEKFIGRMADSTARNADIAKGLDQESAQIDIERFQNPKYALEALRLKYTKLGIQQSMTPIEASLVPEQLLNVQAAAQHKALNLSPSLLLQAMGGQGAAWAGMLGGMFTQDASRDANNEPMKLALNKQIKALLSTGDPNSIFTAHELQLQFGGATNTSFANAKGEKRFSEETDADAFAKFSQRYGDNHWKDFNAWEDAKQQGDTGGMNAITGRLDKEAQGHGGNQFISVDATGAQAEGQSVNAASEHFVSTAQSMSEASKDLRSAAKGLSKVFNTSDNAPPSE